MAEIQRRSSVRFWMIKIQFKVVNSGITSKIEQYFRNSLIKSLIPTIVLTLAVILYSQILKYKQKLSNC